MKVLGIDPGYDRLGVAIIEQVTGKEKVLFSTCLTTTKSQNFAARLLFLGDQLEQIIKDYQPEVLVMEKLFFANNQKTATNVAEVRGMIGYVAQKLGLAIAQYTPLEIKTTVAGYGGADKKQVSSMVEKLVKLPPAKRLDDEYDALAAALTHLACAKFNQPV